MQRPEPEELKRVLDYLAHLTGIVQDHHGDGNYQFTVFGHNSFGFFADGEPVEFNGSGSVEALADVEAWVQDQN